MQCRLCLGSAPTVSIHDNSRPIALRIRTCCRLPVKRGDRLPDAICLTCIDNLELLNTFRNNCLQSNELSKLASDECLVLKTEEVLLEDLMWEEECNTNAPPNICNDEANDWESSALKGSKNIGSQVHRGKSTLYDYRVDDVEIPSVEYSLPKTEEVLLEDLMWEKESGANSPPSNSNEKANEWASSALEKSENIKSPIHQGKATLCDYRADDVEIPSEESPLLKTFKCDICLKSFSQKSTILDHLMIHTEERRDKSLTQKTLMDNNEEIEKRELISSICRIFEQKLIASKIPLKYLKLLNERLKTLSPIEFCNFVIMSGKNA